VTPDTRVAFIEIGHRIDLTADGKATIATSGASDVVRQLSKTQMRHVLRAFRHENFLELDIAKFGPRPGDDVCSLGLTLDHRKTVIRYGCAHPPAEIVAPLKALAHEIQAART